MDVATLQTQSTLVVRQRLTLMVNRYEVWAADPSGALVSLVGLAQQKRLAMKEQVTIYTDESKSGVLAGFRARSVLDLGATYDVTDHAGAPIGQFRKDFARSLLRSTWHVQPVGAAELTGQERSPLVAVLRRFSDLSFLPYHFDFGPPTAPAFSVEKKWGIRDTYLVRITEPRLDRRLVIAVAIALDALQSR